MVLSIICPLILVNKLLVLSGALYVAIGQCYSRSKPGFKFPNVRTFTLLIFSTASSNANESSSYKSQCAHNSKHMREHTNFSIAQFFPNKPENQDEDALCIGKI